MDTDTYGRSSSASRQLYVTCSTITTPCPQVLGYTMGKKLGSGKFAKVKAAWSPFERRMIAIKIVNKRKVNQDDLDKFLPREISILQKVSHPNIITTFQIVETECHCFFALEIAENGDLLDYLNSRGSISEEECRCIFHQMCQAVAYCHALGIAHRDIKLENVFFNKDMNVKIGDFGFALEPQNNMHSTPCGSLSYCAPEILLASDPKYDPFLADSWSMGIVLYAIVMGRLPFDIRVRDGLSNYDFLSLEGSYTDEFKCLVESLLTVDITTRPLIADIAAHTWMTAYPSIRPSWEGPCGGKHTIKNSLPRFLHGLDPHAILENPYPQFVPDDLPQVMDTANPTNCDGSRSIQYVPSSPVEPANDPLAPAHDSAVNASPLSISTSKLSTARNQMISTTDPSSASKPTISTSNSQIYRATRPSMCASSLAIPWATESAVTSILPTSTSSPIIRVTKPPTRASSLSISASKFRSASNPIIVAKKQYCAHTLPISASYPRFSARPVFTSQASNTSCNPSSCANKLSIYGDSSSIRMEASNSAKNVSNASICASYTFIDDEPATTSNAYIDDKPASASNTFIDDKPATASNSFIDNETATATNTFIDDKPANDKPATASNTLIDDKPATASNTFIDDEPATASNTFIDDEPATASNTFIDNKPATASNTSPSANLSPIIHSTITSDELHLSDCNPSVSTSTEAPPTRGQAKRRRHVVGAIRAAGRRLLRFIRRRVQRARRLH